MAGTPAASGWPRRPPVSDAVARELLRDAELELVGRMPWSSNGTFLANLANDDGEMLAIYKPRQGERPLWDFRTGTLCQREVAAYAVSEAFGWEIVPDTVLRDGPLGMGSVQRFVDHDPEEHYFTLLESHAEELRRFGVFDIVINNTDRKGGHCLLGEDGHVWGIDHGVTFHEHWKLRTVIWDFAGARVRRARVRRESRFRVGRAAVADRDRRDPRARGAPAHARPLPRSRRRLPQLSLAARLGTSGQRGDPRQPAVAGSSSASR